MSDEKKIIIDEDWKSQVEAEKEALAQQSQQPPAGPAEGSQQYPPASFELLVTTFVTEAMVALGQFPNPITNQTSPNPAHAKFAIDMLEVLHEKTKGNLTPNEAGMLETLLHQLRMAFVDLATDAGAGGKGQTAVG
jgi:hypothetical protein